MQQTPKLPGFTGDVSLERSTARYGSSARRAGPQPGSYVLAQAQLGYGSRDCISGCLCVTAEGCPCCATIPPDMVAVGSRR